MTAAATSVDLEYLTSTGGKFNAWCSVGGTVTAGLLSLFIGLYKTSLRWEPWTTGVGIGTTVGGIILSFVTALGISLEPNTPGIEERRVYYFFLTASRFLAYELMLAILSIVVSYEEHQARGLSVIIALFLLTGKVCDVAGPPGYTQEQLQQELISKNKLIDQPQQVQIDKDGLIAQLEGQIAAAAAADDDEDRKDDGRSAPQTTAESAATTKTGPSGTSHVEDPAEQV